MDKRFGPRCEERRQQIRETRWADPAAKARHSAVWRDPAFLAREMARRRAVAMEKLPARFWALVDKTGDCWTWSGCRDAKGYGRVAFPGKSERAHRVAWFLTHGSFPVRGRVLRHRCDNPSCVNPDHLEDGDHLDNAHDRVTRNRSTQAKLTIDQVQEIRRLKGTATAKEVASRYGIARDTAANIMAGRCWKSIPWPAGAAA